MPRLIRCRRAPGPFRIVANNKGAGPLAALGCIIPILLIILIVWGICEIVKSCKGGGDKSGKMNAEAKCYGADGLPIGSSSLAKKCCKDKAAITNPIPEGCPQPKYENQGQAAAAGSQYVASAAGSLGQSSALNSTAGELPTSTATGTASEMAATASNTITPSNSGTKSAAMSGLIPGDSHQPQGTAASGGASSGGGLGAPLVASSGAPTATSSSGPANAAAGMSTYAGGGGTSGSSGAGGLSSGDASNGGLSGANSQMAFGNPADQDSAGPRVEDPADYFLRIGMGDNLFKIVEKRYRQKHIQWIQQNLQPGAR